MGRLDGRLYFICDATLVRVWNLLADEKRRQVRRLHPINNWICEEKDREER